MVVAELALHLIRDMGGWTGFAFSLPRAGGRCKPSSHGSRSCWCPIAIFNDRLQAFCMVRSSCCWLSSACLERLQICKSDAHLRGLRGLFSDAILRHWPAERLPSCIAMQVNMSRGSIFRPSVISQSWFSGSSRCKMNRNKSEPVRSGPFHGIHPQISAQAIKMRAMFGFGSKNAVVEHRSCHSKPRQSF